MPSMIGREAEGVLWHPPYNKFTTFYKIHLGKSKLFLDNDQAPDWVFFKIFFIKQN